MNRITLAWRSLRRDHGQALAVVGGITLYILFGLLLWWGLDRYIQPTNSTEKKDLMQALGLLMAGIAGGVGVYFTWRNQRVTQESSESTRESAEENLRLTREGQLIERFTRAIDQLGSEKLQIRLGGIYALEQIARDSPERDYSTVMEVFTAYTGRTLRGLLKSLLNQPWRMKAPNKKIVSKNLPLMSERS
jgi:hypothetical protein